mgnify:CR=1 FL=1
MRRYSIVEIDELRRMCENKYLFGEYFPTGDCVSHSYREEVKVRAVEETLRTLMIAGITADKIRFEYGKK